MVKQLNIDFKPSIYAQYGSLREFVADHLIPRICEERGILKKAIAADMDYSPSHLSQKLSGFGDSRLSSDDIEKIGDLYGWNQIIRYIAYKASKQQPVSALKAQIAELQAQLEAKS